MRLEGTATLSEGHQQDNGQVAHPSSEIPHGHIKELTWVGKDIPDNMLGEPYMVGTCRTCSLSVCGVDAHVFICAGR